MQKPARYTGGEWGEVRKNKEEMAVRVAFCFPEYRAMNSACPMWGCGTLYGVMNQLPDVWCERVFAPWGDMEEAMVKNGLPLWALESQDPVKAFDMVAFTIGYEMSYSNILNMLRLSGIPLHGKDRKGLQNMVFAGGVCAFNPEPLADFVDFFSGRGRGHYRRDPGLLPLCQEAKSEQRGIPDGGGQDPWGLCAILLYPHLQ